MLDISPRTVLFRMTFQIACIESGKIILAAFIWLVSGMYDCMIVVITRDAQTAPPINARLQTLEAAGSSFNILKKLGEKHFHGDDGDGENDHT